MTTYVLPGQNEGDHLHVGWDSKLRTFFATVTRQTPFGNQRTILKVGNVVEEITDAQTLQQHLDMFGQIPPNIVEALYVQSGFGQSNSQLLTSKEISPYRVKPMIFHSSKVLKQRYRDLRWSGLGRHEAFFTCLGMILENPSLGQIYFTDKQRRYIWSAGGNTQ